MRLAIAPLADVEVVDWMDIRFPPRPSIDQHSMSGNMLAEAFYAADQQTRDDQIVSKHLAREAEAAAEMERAMGLATLQLGDLDDDS